MPRLKCCALGNAGDLETEKTRTYSYRFREPNSNEEKRKYDKRYYLANREKKIATAKKNAWNKKYPDRRKAYSKKLWAKLRNQAIDAYGSKCACCGLTDSRFLTFDHVAGGGRDHRKRTGGFGFLLWMEKNNYPSEIQLLCYNCNGAKRVFGNCPHKEMR
ncbi:hypothetical protein LCGC14_2347970 [marine sediment metagenome]|uniref:HNH domain-containing protein n=1 Tax=marine sediment metagenome TaxID=412755 RepID=A0A0F9F535_9ZZZZ